MSPAERGAELARQVAAMGDTAAARANDEAVIRGKRAAEGLVFHGEQVAKTDAKWLAQVRVLPGAPGYLTVRGGQERDRFSTESEHGLPPSAPSTLYALGEDGTGGRTLQLVASRVGTTSTSYRLVGTAAAAELATLVGDGIRFAATTERFGAGDVLVARPWSAFAGVPVESEVREVAHPLERMELGIDSRTT